jgi:hypothetical protein
MTVTINYNRRQLQKNNNLRQLLKHNKQIRQLQKNYNLQKHQKFHMSKFPKKLLSAQKTCAKMSLKILSDNDKNVT